jgi:hypothetical protein
VPVRRFQPAASRDPVSGKHRVLGTLGTFRVRRINLAVTRSEIDIFKGKVRRRRSDAD